MIIFSKGWSDNKDGPGHRRIYYLKGCNLRCRWCASPESISPAPQLLFHPDRTSDFPADDLCNQGAISGTTLNREYCRLCQSHSCRKFKHPALEWVGDTMSVGDILAELQRYQDSWSNMSGVTFGGGEPTLQSDELLELLPELKKLGIHTAMESNASTLGYQPVARQIDVLISDLKAGTADTFRHLTGGALSVVLDNLSWAAAEHPKLLIRVPVITGMNDADSELTAITEILLRLQQTRTKALGLTLDVEILKLHHFGEPKYRALGIPYELSGTPEPAPSIINAFAKNLSDCGITIQRN